MTQTPQVRGAVPSETAPGSDASQQWGPHLCPPTMNSGVPQPLARLDDLLKQLTELGRHRTCDRDFVTKATKGQLVGVGVGSPPREVREGPVHGSLCWSHVCPHQAQSSQPLQCERPERSKRCPWRPRTRAWPFPPAAPSVGAPHCSDKGNSQGSWSSGQPKPGAETRLSLCSLYRLEREARCKWISPAT